MTEGQASISAGILARYAADAASDVEGVRGLAVRVLEYLGRMADVDPASVDVVVDEVGPAS